MTNLKELVIERIVELVQEAETHSSNNLQVIRDLCSPSKTIEDEDKRTIKENTFYPEIEKCHKKIIEWVKALKEEI